MKTKTTRNKKAARRLGAAFELEVNTHGMTAKAERLEAQFWAALSGFTEQAEAAR